MAAAPLPPYTVKSGRVRRFLETVMKAAVMRGHGNIVIEDRPVPEPGTGQALVKVMAAGICGSDLRGYTEENSKARMPGLIIGHEAAGVVMSVGEGTLRVSQGDRVAVDPQVVCGKCLPCRNGWISVCDNKKVIGSSLRGFLDGAMAQYAVIHESQLYKLPDSMSYPEGAMIEPVSNALHAVNRSDIEEGARVVVMGAGTLGLCILQAARMAGAGEVILVGSSSGFRLDLALKLGADKVVKARDLDPVEEVLRISGGKGADVVIDAAGNDVSFRNAVAMSRKRGTIVLFGNADEYVTLNLPAAVYKEISLIGSSGANDECVEAIESLASKRFDVGPIITHRMKLADAGTAFELLLKPGHEAVKIILEPWETS